MCVFLFICSGDVARRWKLHKLKNSRTGQPSPKAVPSFEASVGPVPHTKSAKTPIKVLQLFLTGMLPQSIIAQSNNFAESKGVVLNLRSEELLAFIGMNIAMGLLRLPQVRDHWATDEILSTPWFPSIMPRDRFFDIMRYLHLVDSSLQKKKGEDGYDPL